MCGIKKKDNHSLFCGKEKVDVHNNFLFSVTERHCYHIQIIILNSCCSVLKRKAIFHAIIFWCRIKL